MQAEPKKTLAFLTKVQSGSEIKKRDLFKKCQSRFKRMENMEPAIQILTERGYIREEERQTGGRNSKILTVFH